MNALVIISAKEARAQGLKHYFTGKPCCRGHISKRFVTGGCAICANEDQKRYYDVDPEKYLALNRQYHQSPAVKERNKLRQRIFYSDNAELCRFQSSNCRAERLLRVPSWSQTDRIKSFYAMCKLGHEVDHIIPLQGKLVSGLHVIENLQYLTMEANRSKHNRYEIS